MALKTGDSSRRARSTMGLMARSFGTLASGVIA